MPRDKLEALKAAQSDDYDEYNEIFFNEPVDPIMEAFFKEVEDIRNFLNAISEKVREVAETHEEILATPHHDDKTQRRLEMLMDNIDGEAHQVRFRLKKLQAQEYDEDESSANNRIRSTQIHALSTAIVETMSKYHRLEEEYRQKCKERLRRQLEISGKRTTDSELEEMLHDNSLSVFTQDIITDCQKIRQSVRDIEARHADIIKLEKSIKELHDMFLDMALTVESQGELLDRVEYHVGLARKYVEEGEAGIITAKRFQTKARKKKIASAVCLAIVVIILIVILACIL